MNFTWILKKISEKHSEKDAVIDEGERLTYSDFWDRIDSASNLYQSLDIKKGDRVLIILPNSAMFLVYHFAAMKIGAISVPVKTDYRIWEVSRILKNCQPKIFIAHNEWLEENTQLLQEVDSENILRIDNVSLEDYKQGTDIYPVKNGDIASINYTYFGDGYPKGAALTHGNHIYAATGYSRHQGFNSDDRLLIILPMPHVFTLSGCINSPLIKGGTLVITGNFSPKAIFSDIEKYKITVLTAVPAVFEYLAKFKRKERYNLSSLRLCVTGGELMPEKLQHEFEKMLKKQIVQGYGLTESLPIICNPQGPRNKPGTLGIPGRKDIKIKIVNEKNEEMHIEQIGEILIKSPTTMSGYYNLPDDTEKILKDSWLYTGDLGKIDKDGFLHFCGLKKKIFNIYGNKVDPLEVKSVLLEHPFIEKVNIYLEILSDEEYIIGSKRICADIYVRNGQKISSVEIRDYCKEKIATYKIPEKFNFYTMQ